ncbi:hypothetical protein ACHAPO_002424 [Fusarium lateritium]
MALLSNLLAVSMGSLFNEAPMIAEYTERMVPAFNARFDNHSAFTLGSTLSQGLITTSQYSDHYYIAMANLSSGTTLPPWVSKDYYFQRHEMTKLTKSRAQDTYSIPARGFGATANCTALPAQKVPIFDTPLLDRNMRNVSYDYCGDGISMMSQYMRENTRNRTEGASAQEYVGTLGRNSWAVPCSKILIMGWGRTLDAENLNGSVDASFMTCRPVFETAMFNLTVDAQGHVLSYNRTSQLETTLDYEDWESHTDRIFQNFNSQWDALADQWHNDSTARDWMNYFIVLLTESRDVLDPLNAAPDTESLMPQIQNIYRRVFAIFLSLNEQLFDISEEPSPSTGIRRTEETRIFMEDASFIMTMAILALNSVVAILFYSRAVPFVLPRLPTTLGSTLAYVASSRIAGPAYRAAPGNSSRTFSFGRYIGRDGEVHIGIEMDPHVVPVDPLSLKAKKGFFGRVFRRKSQVETQAVKSGTWL